MAAEKPNDSRGKSGSGERKIRMDGAHAMKTDRPAHLPPAPEVAKAEEAAAAAETPVAEVPVEIRMRSLSEIKAEGTLMDRAAVAHRESTTSRGRGRRGVPQDGQELEEREEQLHQQASEVAAHLRARLHDLDGRETQLNAMAAQLEADTRLARLTLSEREHELAEREAALKKREETFEAAEARLREIRAEAGTATKVSQASNDALSLKILELERQKTEIAGREQNLLARLRELEDKQRQTTQEQKELRQKAQLFESDRAKMEEAMKGQGAAIRLEVEKTMAQRLIDLEAGEAMLTEQARLLDEQRSELFKLREEQEQRLQNQVRDAEEKSRVQIAELEHLRRQQQVREEAMGAREAELLNMRDEMNTLHRQSLEMRLVAEQLWSKISPRMSQEAMAESIASLRMQLLAEQKQQAAELQAQKAEVLLLGSQIQKEFQQLEKRRQELAGWHTHKQEQLDAQSKELAEREGRLVQRQERLQVNISRMDAQKISYERQLNQLRLGRTPSTAK